MSQQRMALWATETEVDEDLQDVDLNLAIGNYGQNGLYEDGACILCNQMNAVNLATGAIAQSRIEDTTSLAMQQQIAQQAFAQIPDVVKRVRTVVDYDSYHL
jgi:translation initiation factor 3 subunit L